MEVFKTALRSLLSNRTRSLLTMLGIMIGVSAVIAMVAIGNGASGHIQSMMDSFGANLLLVMPAPANTTGARGAAGSGVSLTLSDAEAIVNESFAVLRAAPEVTGSAQAVYGNSNWKASITGGTLDTLPAKTWEIGSGVCFSESDTEAVLKSVL